MALKATIYKAQLQLADMDRGVYGEHALTIARHPSETDERMMIRVLAYALNTPPDTSHGALELAKSLWDTDEPDLWQRDLTGQIVHWIDVGQPDERRILRASPRAERVTVYSFSGSTPVWWSNLANKITRARNVAVWQNRGGAEPGARRVDAAFDAVAGVRSGRYRLPERHDGICRDHAGAPQPCTLKRWS